MKILVITATEAEIALSVKHMDAQQMGDKSWSVTQNDHLVHLAVTGIGLTATTYHLTKLLSENKYDLVLQVGVAGSFDKEIALGELVFVTSDRLGDLGAEDHEQYIDVFEMGLVGEHEYPFINEILPNKYKEDLNIDLREVTALTKNKVSGNGYSIAMLKDKYHCDIESMEGAALHYVCISEQVKFAQVRAVSNYVEPRDKESWELRLAIKHINSWLVSHLSKI